MDCETISDRTGIHPAGKFRKRFRTMTDDFDEEWQAMMRGDFDDADDGSDEHHETSDGEDDFTDTDLAWIAEVEDAIAVIDSLKE